MDASTELDVMQECIVLIRHLSLLAIGRGGVVRAVRIAMNDDDSADQDGCSRGACY